MTKRFCIGPVIFTALLLGAVACGDVDSATSSAGGGDTSSTTSASTGEGGSGATSTASAASGGGGANEGGGTSAATDAQTQAAIESATEGLIYISESEAPFSFVTGSTDPGAPIDEALVRAELADEVEADPGADKPLASLFAMERTWSDWKAAAHNCSDPNDPVLVELCMKMKSLEATLELNLSDLRVYYFGANGAPGDVQGVGVTIAIVGRSPIGTFMGVRTLAIWT
jgi:hypothetical protein